MRATTETLLEQSRDYSIADLLDGAGKSETNDGSTTVSFSAEGIEILDVTAAQADEGQRPVVLHVRTEKITPDLAAELKQILKAHPGKTPVHMRMASPGGKGLVVNLTYF